MVCLISCFRLCLQRRRDRPRRGGREGGRGNKGGLDLHGKAIEDEEM